MTGIKNRLKKLETASPDRIARYAEMTDEQLSQCIWDSVRPLCPKYGVHDAPKNFPGADAVERLLGDSLNSILEELVQ